jgi:hypothetical protein
MGRRFLHPAAAFVLIVGCSAGADGSAGDMGNAMGAAVPADDKGAAIALTKAFVERDKLKAVWGSTLQFDKATAIHTQGRTWMVDVPESGVDANGKVVMLGLPSGVCLEVDLDGKTYRVVPLE